MTTPPGIKPIPKPKSPAPPTAPTPPQIAPLPSDASTLPDDAALIKLLKALPLPEVKAILAAYEAFGNRLLFEPRVVNALIAIGLPVDTRLLIHVARLGAEAYVLDVQLDSTKATFAGFIDQLDNLAQGHGKQQSQFLHFSARRLLELSSAQLAPDMQRLQMEKAIELFTFLADELDRSFGLVVASNAVIKEYLQLLFIVMETHYQTLLDDLFAKAGRSRYSAAVKQLAEYFNATTATDRKFKVPPEIPLFRIEGKIFRDFFVPDKASDFGFLFYSKSAPPLTGAGPQIIFHAVLKKRAHQLLGLHELRPGPHSPGAASLPEPPGLHDNVSWQRWARRMWDTGAAPMPTFMRLEEICGYIERYFYEFTVHVPFDLVEGSATPSYLTRTFPRAINGALVHDCLVYAIRWIYILGRLFAPATMPRIINNPRIRLIEMPAHVGVVMRVRMPLGLDALITTNNQKVSLSEVDANMDEDEAAKVAVAGIYGGLKTPIIIHKITADPTDANALFRQIAKIADTKHKLPYNDPSEPFLHYLFVNAEDVAIEKRLNVRLGELWHPMQQRLEPLKKTRKYRSALAQELETYREAIKPAFADAVKEFDKNVKPLANVINDAVEEKLDRIKRDLKIKEEMPEDQFPRGAIVQAGELTNWEKLRAEYVGKFEAAVKSLDLSQIDPDIAFPGDGFPADLQ